MKKISLITLALSTSFAIFAQHHLTTPMSSNFRFGIKAGVNMSEFKESATNTSAALPETQNRTSFNAGFLANLPLGGNLRLQPELYYSGEGSKLSQTQTIFGNTSTSTADVKLNYINLPVLIQLQTE